MPMTLEQLVQLYILQKDYHLDTKNFQTQGRFLKEYATHVDLNTKFTVTDEMASSLFKHQPRIPFVLFKPDSATDTNQCPLIIHTHGGPHVYMDKEKPHAEIGYFLSHGFIVACPNYRGSTNHPLKEKTNSSSSQTLDQFLEIEDWECWENRSKRKHHIFGPEDVYAVTKFLMNEKWVDGSRIYLRGGSFGSYINAHLLADIKNKKYENIYKGAHLSGGVNYPTALSMPDDIPLLITHSIKDDIAPFETARLFMENLLLKQQTLGESCATIQTFIAQNGDHHLIDPKLNQDDVKSQSYQEVVNYLSHSTGFIRALSEGKSYQPTDSMTQLTNVYSLRKNKGENSYLSPMQECLQRLDIYKAIVRNYSEQKNNGVQSKLKPDFEHQTDGHLYGPTMSLLKLQLGEDYTGEVRKDFSTYLKKDFKPTEWTLKRDHLSDAGTRILNNKPFFEQMVQVIERETTFLKANPNYTVMYHAAEYSTLHLYSFINLWINILKEKPINELPVINEMRLFDFMKNSIEQIDVFLIKMRKRRVDKTIFNNIPGFPERAIACDPTLISCQHTTASSSLWWYFNGHEGDRTPIESIISELLTVLGIDSPERIKRYIHLFEKHKFKIQDSGQGLLQQIFVPDDIAKKSVYMCQLWGEEFPETHLNLSSPKIMKQLIHAPEQFEQQLREHKKDFTNFGECDRFGKTEEGFFYANALQMRYLPQTSDKIVTNSYFRSEQLYHEFISELGQLIVEDYADFFVNGNDIPDFIVQCPKRSKTESVITLQTEEVKKSSNIINFSFYRPKPKFNIHAYLIQQTELYKGLVENPKKETYGGIVELDSSIKQQLQNQLRDRGLAKLVDRVSLFSLCLYLKGYTYYDLIKEAVLEVCKTKEEQHSIMAMIEQFSTPSTAYQSMSSYRYDNLACTFRRIRMDHLYDSDIHHLMQDEDGEREPQFLFNHELQVASECVLRHARLAKEMSRFDEHEEEFKKLKIKLY